MMISFINFRRLTYYRNCIRLKIEGKWGRVHILIIVRVLEIGEPRRNKKNELMSGKIG